tara:strand:- start:240 stop:470 length:231 start_codon:yes stop_codon:yes gene_type:complete
MYPQPMILREKILKQGAREDKAREEISNILCLPEENKKLCRDICIVSSCLTVFCIIYSILFLGIAHSDNLFNLTSV